MITSHIIVTPKRSVLDPQGEAVKKALQSLGLTSITGVRVGKYIELEIDLADTEANRASLQKKLETASNDLLSNPVIEDYQLTLVDGKKPTPPPAAAKPKPPVEVKVVQKKSTLKESVKAAKPVETPKPVPTKKVAPKKKAPSKSAK